MSIKKLIQKLQEKKISTFSIMCVITVMFMILPLIMKIPIISSVIAWIMSALKYQEYKSAYLGLIGGLVGSWLAITGAIYTQQKINKDTDKRKEQEEIERRLENKKYAKGICRSFLLNEIRQNDKIIKRHDKSNFYKELKEKDSNWNLGEDIGISVEKWKEIRIELLKIDTECANLMFGVYKYYEPLIGTVFHGKMNIMKERYGLDYNQYEKDYQSIIDYLERG